MINSMGLHDPLTTLCNVSLNEQNASSICNLVVWLKMHFATEINSLYSYYLISHVIPQMLNT